MTVTPRWGTTPRGTLSDAFSTPSASSGPPAAGLVVPDPVLLDQVTPLRELLHAGLRPRIADADTDTAVAVLQAPGRGPAIALGHLTDGVLMRAVLNSISESAWCARSGFLLTTRLWRC